MIMKRTIFLPLLLTGITCVSFIAMGGAKVGNSVVELERNGIAMDVPLEYLYKNRFPWIDKVEGLDSDENSFLIKIPASEIEKILPPEVSQGPLRPHDLTVLVHLLSDAEYDVMQVNRRSIFDEIVDREPYFKEAYEELDGDTGWYRVYESPNLTSSWYMFLDAPYSGDRLTNVDSLIALCSNDTLIGRPCNMFTMVQDKIAIEMSMKYEHLPYHKNIRNYVFGLLKGWQNDHASKIKGAD